MLAPAQPTTGVDTDHELLARYAARDDRAALAELLRRYAPIVYSAARRQTRDATLAEDVSQCVFIAFTRRAKSIRSGSVLGAWLMQTTRFAALNALKLRARRRHYEQAACTSRRELDSQSDPSVQSEHNWQSVEPVLDEAISRLPAADQTAVVLKFFRGLTTREIAAMTGATEQAVQKRVGRAIERLRKQLAPACGAPAALSVGALGRLLASRAVEAAPAQLLAHAAAASAGNASAPMLYGAFTMTAKTKVAIAVVTAAILLAGAAGFAVLAGFDQTGSSFPTPPSAPADPPPSKIVLDITATIDGSDVLNITPAGVSWTHLAYQAPSGITFNGSPVSTKSPLNLEKIGLSDADLSTATVLSRSGRGAVALDKTNVGAAIHFSDPEPGSAPYEIKIAFLPVAATAAVTPAPVTVVQTQPSTTLPSADTTVLDIKAFIDGCDLLTITPQGAQWQHTDSNWPSSVLLNDRPWDVQTAPVLDDIGLTGADLSTAQVVDRTAPDTAVMEKTPSGVAIYFADANGGGSQYEIKIRFSHTK